MRFVIDLQGAQSESRYRGIGRYTVSLVQHFLRVSRHHEVFLVLSGLFKRQCEELTRLFRADLSDDKILVWCGCGPSRNSDPRNEWRNGASEILREGFIASLQPDAVFIPSLFEGYVDDAVLSVNVLGLDIPTAVTIYDLIPLINAAEYLDSNPNYKRFYTRRIAQLTQATAGFAISESARQEALKYLPLPQDAVINVGCAVEDLFCPASRYEGAAHPIHAKYALNGKFVLYSGGSDERKNLARLVEAYALLPRSVRSLRNLVLAGRMPEGDVARLRAIASTSGLASSELVFTGYVTDDELIQLYRSCEVFVLPSWHEGFGLPALEAMRCGAATLGANATSIPEVIGSPDALFDPLDVNDMARKLERAITDPEFHAALKANASLQADRFSWSGVAQRCLGKLEEIGRSGLRRDWKSANDYGDFVRQTMIAALARLEGSGQVADSELLGLSVQMSRNRRVTDRVAKAGPLGQRLKWRVEGPFDSSYSLALVNREIALALERRGHEMAMNSTDGPGDFPASASFLRSNPDIARMDARAREMAPESFDISSRNIYPPRVSDMRSRLNLLHQYAWEETGYSAEWVDHFNDYLDGMAVTSKHVRKVMIDHGVRVPIAVCENGVDHWERIRSTEAPRFESRGFRFLHVSSCFPRKGADAMLAAYGRAFSDRDDVTLVIKTFSNPHNEIRRWLAEARGSKSNYPDVVIIEEDLDDGQLKALYEQCDALIAPSRAEGFGLPMAEAMLSGLAVITTGWSGQVDFCNAETAWLVDYRYVQAQTHLGLFDSVWAEPDVEHMAALMREVHQLAPVERIKRSKRGRELLLDHFTWDAAASSLEAFARTLANGRLMRPGRVGWVSSWNTRCGIATYSAHLLDQIEEDVTILAAEASIRTFPDEDNVTRCWRSNGRDSLDKLGSTIKEMDFDVVLIQFNYGFYDFGSLARLIDGALSEGRVVAVTLHATTDPESIPGKKLASLVSVLSRCHRLFVHSPGDLNRLKALGLVDNVTLFPHGVLDVDPAKVRTQPMKDARFTLASYGFFLPHKGLAELIEAIALLRNRGVDVQLRMVNAQYPVAASEDLIEAARSLAGKLGVRDFVEMHTEFLADDDSLALLNAADLIVFPYQDTGESASGAVRYGLMTGKPVAVTPLAIFEDVASATHRLPGQTPEAIADGLQSIMQDLLVQSPAAQAIANQSEAWRAAHRYSLLGRRFGNILHALHQEHEGLAASS